MSHLRVESVRLVWIEAFIALAEKKNISAAARLLDVDRSTLIRNIAMLEKWLYRSLISTKAPYSLTIEGGEFLPTAKGIVRVLRSWKKERPPVNKALVEYQKKFAGQSRRSATKIS